MPIQLLAENPLLFFAWIIAIIMAITIHEFSHVLAAYVLGDATGKDLGRLTLNPFAHLDPLGLLLLAFAGFGWGRPAPFNPYNLRHPRLGSAIIALAGPVSNFLVILVFGLLFRFLLPNLNLADGNLLVIFIVFLIQINLVLMVFNLLPIPPLDGSRVLLNALPDRFADLKIALERYGPFILLFLILFAQQLFVRLFAIINSLTERLLG